MKLLLVDPEDFVIEDAKVLAETLGLPLAYGMTPLIQSPPPSSPEYATGQYARAVIERLLAADPEGWVVIRICANGAGQPVHPESEQMTTYQLLYPGVIELSGGITVVDDVGWSRGKLVAEFAALTTNTHVKVHVEDADDYWRVRYTGAGWQVEDVVAGTATAYGPVIGDTAIGALLVESTTSGITVTTPSGSVLTVGAAVDLFTTFGYSLALGAVLAQPATFEPGYQVAYWKPVDVGWTEDFVPDCHPVYDSMFSVAAGGPVVAAATFDAAAGGVSASGAGGAVTASRVALSAPSTTGSSGTVPGADETYQRQGARPPTGDALLQWYAPLDHAHAREPAGSAPVESVARLIGDDGATIDDAEPWQNDDTDDTAAWHAGTISTVEVDTWGPAPTTITGFSAVPPDAAALARWSLVRLILVVNVGLADLVLAHQDAGSAGKLWCPSETDLTVGPGQCVWLFTDPWTGLLRVLQSASPAAVVPAPRVVTILLDGGGAPITTGIKGSLKLPANYTWTAWELLSLDNTTGSISIQLWRDTYAHFGSGWTTLGTTPSLSSAVKNSGSASSSLTGGDWLAWYVASASGVGLVALSLTLEEV